MKKSTFFSLVFSFLIFLTLNIPSVKIFYSSQIINLIAFAGLWGVGLFRFFSIRMLQITKDRIKFLVQFYIIWATLFLLTLIKSPTAFSFNDLIQYVITMLLVTAVILFIDKKDVSKVLIYQTLWATFLAITHLTVGIKLSRELGQHYLTLGMPLVAGVVCAFSLLFYLKSKKMYKIGMLVSIYLPMSVLFSLNGRSPLLLSILVPIIIILLSFLTGRGIWKKTKTLLAVVAIGVPIGYFVYNKMSDSPLFYRISRAIYNMEEEPRNVIYNKSLDLIKKNPLGYGLRPEEFSTSYPHNIFLEIGVSGGILALLAFLFFMILISIKIVNGIKIGSYALATSALVLVFFLTWNLSYDLTSSYIPFVAMAILVAITEKDGISYVHKTEAA